jgi:hypothetical protein
MGCFVKRKPNKREGNSNDENRANNGADEDKQPGNVEGPGVALDFSHFIDNVLED